MVISRRSEKMMNSVAVSKEALCRHLRRKCIVILEVPIASWMKICYTEDTYKIFYTDGYKLKHRK